jgi:putative hydrolase of the HAD superfamily
VTRWKAIVFDLDDTLFPEIDFVCSGFRAVAEWAEMQLGVPGPTGFEALRRIHSEVTRDQTFDRWLEEMDRPASHLTALIRVYREHQPALEPFPGVRELLEAARVGHKIGLITDGHLSVQRAKFAALGLSRYFDATVFSDEWGRQAWKPDCRPFVEVLRMLAASAPEAIYVADNPMKDFLGAKALGMHTVWARHSGGYYCQLAPPTPRHAADEIACSISDLRDLLVARSATAEQ